jgi:hypothetical protein
MPGLAGWRLCKHFASFLCRVSVVVYARMSEAVTRDLQARAAERGLTLNRAVVELLEQALSGSANAVSLVELEAELAQLRDELAQTRAQLREAELRLDAGAEREALSARTLRALAERARHELAVCPRCREPVRGTDLLVSGHCPKESCRALLTSLLTPTPKIGAPEKDEYFALLGALGALVGLALATPEQRAA